MSVPVWLTTNSLMTGSPTTGGVPVNVWPVLGASKVAGADPAQMKSSAVAPLPVSCRESPTGLLDASATPMSTDVMPSAGPPTAAKEPS